MGKSIELILNSLKYNIMSSQEQEAEERRLIFAYLKQMMEFFDISGTPEIRRDMDEYKDSDGYYISFHPHLNDILFQNLNLKTFRYEFIEKIVGYSPDVGNFPIVKSIHDLYLVITAMYKRFVTMGKNNGFPRYHIGQSVMVDVSSLINHGIGPDVKELNGKVAKITNVRPFGKSFQYKLNNGAFWILENKLLPILDNYKDTKFSIIKAPSIISLNFNY